MLPLFAAVLLLGRPDTYLDALERANVYDELPSVAAAQLSLSIGYQGTEQAGEGGPPQALRSLTEEQWRGLLATILAPDVLHETIDPAVRSVFAATESADNAVTLSFTRLRERLQSGAAVDAYLTLMRAQPPCGEAQLAILTQRASVDLPTCRPPEEVIAQLRPAIETALAGVVSGIPDQRQMADALSPETLAPVRTARTLLLLSPLVPLVLLALVAAFGATSRRAVFRWCGTVLAVAGGAVASAALLFPGLFEQRWTTSVVPSVPPYWSPRVLTLAHDVAAGVVGAYTLGLALVTGAVALGGLMLIVLSLRAPRAAAVAVPTPQP